MSNFLENSYYSYHYSYLTTQLFDDLTTSEVNINCEICICQIFSGSNITIQQRLYFLTTEVPLYDQIKSFESEIHRIGKCLEARSAKKAIYEGMVLGCSI